MEIFERIRLVRESENLGRHKFSEVTGINKESLIRIEQGKSPKFAAIELEKVARAFPEWMNFLLLEIAEGEIEKRLASTKDYRK